MRDQQSRWAIPSLKIELNSRAEFQKRFLSGPPHGGLLVTTQEQIQTGDVIDLLLLLSDSQEEYRIRGLVLWCRKGAKDLVDAGIGFFATESEKRERLLVSSPSQPDVRERQDDRYTTTLKVTYETTTDFVVDYTRNISSGGFFVDSQNPPAIGSKILFRLYPPGQEEPIDLPGQVTWHQPGKGFGVRFAGANPAAQERLDYLVRSISVGAHEPARIPLYEEVSTR